MQSKEFKLRRDKLLNQIGAGNIAIIFAAKECVRSNTEYYPYRQNSNFYYLTGFTEPDAIAVFVPERKEGEFILFNLERDATKEIWHGQYIGQTGACQYFGADQAFSITKFDLELPHLLANRKRLDDATIENILYKMRLKKDISELALMRKAAEITASGYLRAMQKCRPGIYEFELEAELLYEFMRLGGRYEAFKTVVGGGANACTLHYSKNTDKLIDGDLVLVDAGVEYKYYCADVTRTFPVNGKFTPKQRDIYTAVLETQLEVINNIYPGRKFGDLQIIAENTITKYLTSLNLLTANQRFKKFFMHKIGHLLGLDVHDVGKLDILEPGMVFTVEPGIYIAQDNIGIRIEDDILVTETGCDILTKAIPKTIEEIEAIMT